MSDWNPTKKSINEILSTSIYDQIPNYVFLNIIAEVTEPFLGTVPKDPTIYASYIAKKAENKYTLDKEKVQETDSVDEKAVKKLDEKEVEKIIAEETKTVPEEASGWTGFHTDEEGIFFYNYMLIGNIKSNLKLLGDSNAIPAIRAFKKASDICIAIEPRRIRFYEDKKPIANKEFYKKDGNTYRLVKPISTMERPLRASTPQGERVTLTRSDIVETGTRFEFSIKLFRNNYGLTPEILIKAIKAGEIHGLGQWRGSGGYGTFKILSVGETKYNAPKKGKKNAKSKKESE